VKEFSNWHTSLSKNSTAVSRISTQYLNIEANKKYPYGQSGLSID